MNKKQKKKLKDVIFVIAFFASFAFLAVFILQTVFSFHLSDFFEHPQVQHEVEETHNIGGLLGDLWDELTGHFHEGVAEEYLTEEQENAYNAECWGLTGVEYAVLKDDYDYAAKFPVILSCVNEENVPYYKIADKPCFSEQYIMELQDENMLYEDYSELDSLGRCGSAFAVICKDIMPKKDEERGNISSVKPTGWMYDGKSNNAEYKDLISDSTLYNRCHLIGYQLAGENANKLNLITGTRYMNVDGMLPFENQIADYIKDNPDSHVLYQVTPVFIGSNLVANGVIMSAISCEDGGEDVCFCVFCPNVQAGVFINYENGVNHRK